MAVVALLLAPSVALADDECGLQTLPGTAETVTCNPGDYAGGITYSSLGDLTLEVPDDTVDLTVNADGVNVTGNLADSVFWDSSAFVSGNIVGTGGAVLDYSSDTGAIDITTGSAVLGNGNATHGIEATSNSGNIDIATGGQVTGDQFGIQAATGGSADLTITAAGPVNLAFQSEVGVAAIDATTGTGLLTIDIVTGSGTISGGVSDESQGAAAIRANGGGDALVNVAAGRTVTNGLRSDAPVMDLLVAGETIINNAGVIQGLDGTAILAAGGSLVLNNDNSVSGALDFSGLTGGYIFNNNAGSEWNARSASGQVANLGAGEFNNAGTIQLNRGDFISAPGTTFTGSGDSLLDVRQVLLNGQGQTDCATPTIAICLDLAGGATSGRTEILITVEKIRNAQEFSNDSPLSDVVTTALNPGIVLVDVGGGTSHAGDFVLHPGSLALVDKTPEDPNDDLTVVPLYTEDSTYGPVLKTGGLFDYTLLYNPDTQQHLLASVPQETEYVTIVHEALSIWHTTADAVAGRQADLSDGTSGGIWYRLAGEQTRRDATPSLTTHGNSFVYDHDYSLNTGALMVGYDMLAEDNLVLGVHGGIVTSKLEHRNSGSRDSTKGAAIGAYGSWWDEAGLTLDGAVNVNMLTLNHTPDEDQEESDSNIVSLGARVEAGWRLPVLGEALYAQPLVTAAYVDADIEDLDLRSLKDASFEDTKSSRAALGVRLGGETEVNGDKVDRIGYWLTVRAWEEYAGEDSAVRFPVEGGEALVIEDDISGTFEEVGFGVKATNADGTLSGYFSGGAKFADDTDSYNVSVGLRKRW